MSDTADNRGMTTDRWRRIEALYHEMLARPVHERAAALVAACAGDAALQAEVQSLLDQPESAAGFLATPAMELAARLVPPASSLPQSNPALAWVRTRSRPSSARAAWAACSALATLGWAAPWRSRCVRKASADDSSAKLDPLPP